MIYLNKIKKIIGSIYTSFLYILLCVLIIIEFTISYIRTNDIELNNIINGESIYKYVCNGCNLPKEFLIEYLDNYSNYLFYRRNYPTINYSALDNSQRYELNKIKERIDIPYKQVLIIRDINTYIHNNSVFLIINISIFLLFVLLCLRYKSFIRGLYFFSLTVLLCSLVILMFSTYFVVNINNYYLKEILNSINIMPSFYKINTMYIVVAFVLSLLSLCYNLKVKSK